MEDSEIQQTVPESKVVTHRKRIYSWFIGIDISADKLDCMVLKSEVQVLYRQIENTADVIDNFLAELKSIKGFTLSKSIFCMEQTGIYSSILLRSLKRIRANVVIENPVQIRNSMGLIRNKYDKIDALRIAQYARLFKDKLRFWADRRLVIKRLAGLQSLRQRMIKILTILRVRIKTEKLFAMRSHATKRRKLCNHTMKALKEDLNEIDNAIRANIADDPVVSRLMDIITSIPGIGSVTALSIIICTNEFKNIRDPRKFACYAGVAPFVHESGKSKGKAKVSTMANKQMKALLHICALCAIKKIPELKEYYRRKTLDEGKPKMSVINAIRYKLILRIFACVNQGRRYNENYVSQAANINASC